MWGSEKGPLLTEYRDGTEFRRIDLDNSGFKEVLRVKKWGDKLETAKTKLLLDLTSKGQKIYLPKERMTVSLIHVHCLN